MSPPTTANSEPFGEHITVAGDPDPAPSNTRKRRIMADLNVSRTEAHHILRRRADGRTRALVRDLLADDFEEWLRMAKRSLSACDQRIGGPNWRTSS